MIAFLPKYRVFNIPDYLLVTTLKYYSETYVETTVGHWVMKSRINNCKTYVVTISVKKFSRTILSIINCMRFSRREFLLITILEVVDLMNTLVAWQNVSKFLFTRKLLEVIVSRHLYDCFIDCIYSNIWVMITMQIYLQENMHLICQTFVANLTKSATKNISIY